MAKLSAREIIQRGKELEPARKLAFKFWEQNPNISAAGLRSALWGRGYQVVQHTCYTWLTKWRLGKGYSRKPKLVEAIVPGLKGHAKVDAFQIWKYNQGITGSQLLKGLIKLGHKVPRTTVYSWVNRWNRQKAEVVEPIKEKLVTALIKPKLRGGALQKRAEELEPARRKAFEIWQKDPKITYTQLWLALKQGGFVVKLSTCDSWLVKWRKGKGYAKPRIYEVEISVPLPKLTWEQVIEAVPDRSELALLLLDGITARMEQLVKENEAQAEGRQGDKEKIDTLTKNLEEMTEDRKKIMQQLNHYIAKEKTGGHYTLDQDKKILILKT